MGSGAQTSDRSLVQRMLAGDERAFDAFFNGYFPPLYRFALARTHRDETLAEEVVQAVMCRAVTKLHTFRGEASLLTWLCTFCRYEISAVYESRSRHRREVSLTEDAPEIRAALESMSCAPAGPEHELRRKEVARQVHTALDRLPPHYGQALAMKYIEGRPVNEIAAVLRLGPKATESLLVRARKAFREGFLTLCGTGPIAPQGAD
jgi:RNA polymerase sigma-70 factor, ECF subfamily